MTIDLTAEPRVETTDRSITYGWHVGQRRWKSPRVDDPRDLYEVWITLTVRHNSDRKTYTATVGTQEEQPNDHGRSVCSSFGAPHKQLMRIPTPRFNARRLGTLASEALAILREVASTDTDVVNLLGAVEAQLDPVAS